MHPQFRIEFKEGAMSIINRRMFETLTKGWNGVYLMTLEKERKKRSGQQNKYYHGVIVAEIQQCIIEATGEFISPDNVHEFLKLRCNPKRIGVSESTGETAEIGGSTTELTTVQFEEYQDRCRDFAYEFFGCTITLPNEQKEIAV